MVPRAQWKGYLKLSLVSCPIVLYPALSAAERISFRQVNRQTGHRLRQQMVDSVTGEIVQSHEKGRGYEVGEQQLLLVQDEELEAAQREARSRPAPVPQSLTTPSTREPAVSRLAEVGQRGRKPPQLSREELGHREAREDQGTEPDLPSESAPRVENNRTIEIDRCVSLAEIDPRYHDTPYYIVPRDEVSQEAFAVIRDAMQRKKMVGMGRVVLAKRERPIILRTLGRGFLGMTLRYAHEVRSEAEIFADIPDLTLPDEMVEVAEHILSTKVAAFDPSYLEDRYRTALVSMLKSKQTEAPRKARAVPPSPQNVIDLMEALKKSLGTELAESIRKPARPRRSAPANQVKAIRRRQKSKRT